MALSKVTFTRTDGNLGTALAGQDHISGLLFDTTSAPGTTSLGDVYQIFSVKDAEGLGILPYKTGETVYMDGLPHLHISEYFRLNPNGTLYVMSMIALQTGMQLLLYKASLKDLLDRLEFGHH